MAFGTVYIFNLYTEVATLTGLNGQGQAGSPIAAPTKGASAPFWVPAQTSVPRTNLAKDQLSSPMFVNVRDNNEANDLSINYGGQSWRATVSIPNPPTPHLESDLWLYLAYEEAFLFDATIGAIIPQPGGAAIKLQKV